MNISRMMEEYFVLRRLGRPGSSRAEGPGVRRGEGSEQRFVSAGTRALYAYLEAWTSITLNIALAAAKVYFGFILNSISLLADGVHTASDVITSVIVLLGFKTANVPPDEEHPFGHGRTESVATLAISILLIIVGLGFGYDSVSRLLERTAVRGSYAAAALMMVSVVVKEWLARFSTYLGRTISSNALVADAWHHRSDAIASALVVVAMVGANMGYSFLDAVFGLLVSALIVWTGAALARETSSVLMGKAPSPSFVGAVETIVSEIPGVDGMHKLSVHDYGTRKALSLHIQVDKNLTLRESHDIAESVERAIENHMDVDVVVHVEPFEDD